MIAVIGPRSSSGSKHTHPLCAGLHVPQVTPDATDSTLSYTLGDYRYLIKVSTHTLCAGLHIHWETTATSLRLVLTHCVQGFRQYKNLLCEVGVPVTFIFYLSEPSMTMHKEELMVHFILTDEFT